jgi:magnesium-transporting ATPase (P-type)
MNLYSLALTLGFLFFIIQLYLVFISGAAEPGMTWFIFLALSIAFFSLAIFRKYEQEKQDKLKPPPPKFVGATRKETKKLIIAGLSLLVCAYLLGVWTGGWLFPLLIPMWGAGLTILMFGLRRSIR